MNQPERLLACPLTIHALLHIAPSIGKISPAWLTWAFSVERFCGTLLLSVKSQQFLFASLDNYVSGLIQLELVHLAHGAANPTLLPTWDQRQPLT